MLKKQILFGPIDCYFINVNQFYVYITSVFTFTIMWNVSQTESNICRTAFPQERVRMHLNWRNLHINSKCVIKCSWIKLYRIHVYTILAYDRRDITIGSEFMFLLCWENKYLEFTLLRHTQGARFLMVDRIKILGKMQKK